MSQEMERFWDERAREDAAYFVDSVQEYGRADMERFWRSGAGIIDQGGLLFADSVELVANAMNSTPGKNISTSTTFSMPTRVELAQRISKERFTGESSPIRLHTTAGILVTSLQVAPVILGVQEDGSLQIVG